jgi:HD-GYP domain-containing protein (c-di-GMP phosphodiesterase class II)
MSDLSAEQFGSSRSLWQEMIFELRRADTFLPTSTYSDVDAALNFVPRLEQDLDGVRPRTVLSSVKLALSALDTFSRVLNSIDRSTHDHSERVARNAVRLARCVGVGTDELKRLQLGALLHDCGKIHINSAILNKAGALTDSEYSEVKSHPVHGVRILRSVPALRAAIPAVLHHHERFDGTGYPAGLGGNDIPLAARIVCIADAYDAMISDRPYRRGLSRREARENLCLCRGTQFDPDLVEVFVDGLNVGAEDVF